MADIAITDSVAAPSNPMASNEAGNNSGSGSEQSTEGLTTEDLYELQAGKNPDGTALTKKVTKADLIKLAQTGFGANERFEEAKATKNQMIELAKMLRDPERVFEVLKEMGHNPDELFLGRYNKNLQEQLKTPEERDFERLQAEAEQWRKYEAKRLKDEEESAITTRAEAIKVDLYTKLESALTKTGIKATKDTVAEAARYIGMLKNQAESKGQNFNIAEIPVDKIASHLRKRYTSGITGYLGELDEDSILSEIPDDLLNKIGKALSKKYSGQTGSKPIENPVIRNNVVSTPTKKKFMSMDESRGGKSRFS